MENIYKIIKFSNYNRLIKKYTESEKLLRQGLKENPQNIGLYLNLGELYFEMKNDENGVKCFLCVMHLLIRRKILKRKGKIKYKDIERKRDDEFIKNIKSKNIEKELVIYKDNNLSWVIGNIFTEKSDDERKIEFGQKYFLEKIDWNNIENSNVDIIYK